MRRKPHQRRVFVRPPKSDDCAEYLAAVRRSRSLHHPWVRPRPRDRRAFATYLKRFTSGPDYALLVIHRESGAIAGDIHIMNVVRGAFQSAALGYYAFSPYAGQGLIYEAMLLVIQHAFKKLKLHRLEANIQPANRASIVLAQKCGFVCKGLSPRMLKIGGRWRDHERWALLSENFRPIKNKP